MSRIGRSHGGSLRIRSGSDISNITNVVIGKGFSKPRRHVSSTGSTMRPVAQPHPPQPPCVAQIFNPMRLKKDPITMPTKPGGSSPRNNPPMDSAIGTSIASEVDATKPEKHKIQVEEGRMGSEFWRDIAPYKNTSAKEFLSWRWCTKVCDIL